MSDRVSEELLHREKLGRWRQERDAKRAIAMDKFPDLLVEKLSKATDHSCEVTRSISDGILEDRFLKLGYRHFGAQDSVGIYFYPESSLGTVLRTRICEMRINEMDGLESIGNPMPFCAVYHYLWPPGVVARRLSEEDAAENMIALAVRALADCLERGEKIVSPKDGAVRLANQEAWYRD